MGANLRPRAETWNTWKQKLHLKAAASSARPCRDKRRRRRPGPGVGFFAISADLLAVGQDVWSRSSPLIAARHGPARGLPPGTAGLLAARGLQMQFCCSVFLLAPRGAQMLKMNSEKVT